MCWPHAPATADTGQGKAGGGEHTCWWNVCRLDTYTFTACPIVISWSARLSESNALSDGPLLASSLTLTFTFTFMVAFEVAVTVSRIA
jgi:hypothetical protein